MNTINRLVLISIALATCCSVYAKDESKTPDASSKKGEQQSSDSGQFHVLRKVKLGGEGGWDYLTIDSDARRLYISRGNRVMVVDIDSDKVVGEITGVEGVHGVSVAPEFKKGFITCGKEDKVRIFDLSTLKLVSEASTGAKPDGSVYDPASKCVFAFNHEGASATAIDAATGKVKGQIELGGEPESGAADGKGKVFVNLEDKSKIAVIDSKKLKLLSTWSIAPGEEPTGLALDTKHGRLFSGCHNNLMIVTDANSGKQVAKLPIGKGVDAGGFDDQTQNAFSSNGDGTLTVVNEASPQSFSVLQNVATQAGARTMAVDTKKHEVWLVSATPKAESEKSGTEKGEAGKGGHRRRQFEPDSFTAIVVGK